jgi:hypothetical protein
MTLLTVERYALKMEEIANELERDRIHGDQKNGHAVILRRMAGEMRADAALGCERIRDVDMHLRTARALLNQESK